MRARYPEIESSHLYIDTLAMEMVRDPAQFEIIVTSNMFGDIISDLGAQLQGGLGVAPSANINPGVASMFETVHGSAPKLAGTGVTVKRNGLTGASASVSGNLSSKSLRKTIPKV